MGRIVKCGEEAACGCRDLSGSTAGLPACLDPEGAENQDCQRGGQSGEKGETMVNMKLLSPLDVHGQRSGESAASRFDVRSQVAHVLPEIHQFAKAQEQAVAHDDIPSGA